MNVKWKLFNENFGTEKHVAIMKKEDGTCILTVYEERKFHVAIPSKSFSFLGISYFPRIEEWDYVRSNFTEALSNDNLMAEKCLEHACKEFEKKFNEHVKSILELLS